MKKKSPSNAKLNPENPDTYVFWKILPVQMEIPDIANGNPMRRMRKIAGKNYRR
ncbi:MAG: hypothetical protein A4E40_00309 [Methanoregulaceae archaeon PtaU1.Bin059]|nr:MAG: hypothetical protein A4E40_00309 [Methanoregulaceae archaeon PtaU1.Bin059]